MVKLLTSKSRGILHAGTLFISFGFVFLILLSLVLISYLNSEKKDKSAQLVVHTKDVIHESERVLSGLDAIENNSRAYIITGMSHFIDSTSSSEGDIRDALYQLKRLSGDEKSLNGHLRKLDVLISERLNFTHETILLRKTKGFEAARQMIETKKGIHISNEIRSQICQIQKIETNRLAERSEKNQKYLSYSKVIEVVIQVSLLLILIAMLVLIIRAVKTQEESENKLRASSEWFRRTLAGIGDGVIATDQNGIITYLNPIAESLTGWTLEDSAGKSVDLIFEIVNEESRLPAVNPVKTVIKEKRICQLEKNTILIRKDKSEISIDDSAAPIFGEAGDLLGTVLVFRDIEKQRIAERLIVKSNERFTKVFDLSPVAICILDENSGKIYLHNSAFLKLLDITVQTATGEFLSKFIDVKMLANDNSIDIHTRAGTKNIIVSNQTIELDLRPCNVMVFVDNTERKKLTAELELLNNELEKKVKERTSEVVVAEKKFRALIEQNHDIIVLTDANGKVVYQSPSVERILGWNETEYKAMAKTILVHSSDIQKVNDLYKQVNSNPGIPFHIVHRIRNKSGQYFWMEGFYTNLQNDPDINAVVANLHDVTDRVLVTEEIKSEKKRIEGILQNMGDAFVSIDRNWDYTFVNKRALELMEKTSSQVIGRNIFDVFPDIKGTEFEINFRKVMEHNEQVSFETYYPSYDMWLNVRVFPFADGITIFYTDISREKSTQQQIINLNEALERRVRERTEELQEANREMESFSYSISHDLRAPLRSILNYSEILKQDFTSILDEKAVLYLSKIKKSAEHMDMLIRDLLMFSKINKRDIRRIMLNMEKLVREVAETERNSAVSGKHIEMEIKPLINVLGDESMIRQVMQNLISNAIKYSSKKDTPMIEIGAYTQSGYTTFYVKDNGAGFEMEYYDKLFAVFQRLHSNSEFEGTGVGLALANRIIQKHGGKMWAESEVGKGATFYFSLPNQ